MNLGCLFFLISLGFTNLGLILGIIFYFSGLLQGTGELKRDVDDVDDVN